MSHPQEVVRQASEMEGGGLSGPANSVESIDCGCGRYRLPGLVRFATRRTFIVLLCSIGLVQAASQAYFHVVSSTVARRYQIDPVVMEWVLYMSEIAPVLFGVAIAYWGDRIHRAAWLGGFTLVQCAAFLSCVIPHIPYNKDSEVTTTDNLNVTHMSVYAEESPDLCTRRSSRIFKPNNQDQMINLIILIAAQVVNGIAAVTYYALGLSYLDDNTKSIHVPIYFGVIIASKILGSAFGYVLGWGFLGIDADNLSFITSYRDQVGAWWLGWPIFTVLLLVPAIFMAVFPRKLPSEIIQRAASTILENSGTIRGSQRVSSKKVGSPSFLPSMLRLVTNKILVLNILGASFLMTGLINFLAKENIFLESRFQVPRPNGMLLGFGDPLLSRTITTTVKPIIAGLIVIITGYEIARVKPTSRIFINFSMIMIGLSALVMLLQVFNGCNKAPVVGIDKRSASWQGARMGLLQFCNRDCQCSRDADFRPICDSRSSNTFYSPCHAGCTVVENANGSKTYTNCTCIDEPNGEYIGNLEARDGPCYSNNCQSGWLMFEMSIMLVCAAIASTIVGDLLISLRSVNPQDKALAIGFAMAVIGLFTYIPGKIGYDGLSNSKCVYWGIDNRVCHLHSENLGTWICFLTAGLFGISMLFKSGVWLFAPDLDIFDPHDNEDMAGPRELDTLSAAQAEPLLQQTTEDESNDNQRLDSTDRAAEPSSSQQIETKRVIKEDGPVADIIGEPSGSQQLKYGPVGPGNRRIAKQQSNDNPETDDELDSSDGSQIARKDSVSQVSYKPLELDSDVESELGATAERSRKRISKSDFEENRKSTFGVKAPFGDTRFPNPDNYEDPRAKRSSGHNTPTIASKATSNLDLCNKPNDKLQLSASKGDFNEIGIPLVESYQANVKGSTTSLRTPTVMMTLQQFDREPSREFFGESSSAFKPTTRKNDSAEIEENRKFRLENLMQPPIDYQPPVPTSPIRPPSRDQASSGFGSLQDIRERLKLQEDNSDSRDSIGSNSPVSESQKLGSPLCTDL